MASSADDESSQLLGRGDNGAPETPTDATGEGETRPRKRSVSSSLEGLPGRLIDSSRGNFAYSGGPRPARTRTDSKIFAEKGYHVWMDAIGRAPFPVRRESDTDEINEH